jgi:serralysin
MMRRSLSAAGVVALAGASTVLWAPSASSAQQGSATAEVPNESVIEYRAGAGQINDVVVTDGPERLQVVIDDVVPIEAGQGCAHPDEADRTRVVCAITLEADPHHRVELFLDDMDDTLDAAASVWQVVHGGAGDDALADSAESQTYNEFNGDDGDDTISGAEWQIGGGGSDALSGTDRDDNLNGQWGNDTIRAGDGDDWLKGAAGNDSLYGEAGDDTMLGDAGDDLLEGGQGTDQIDGGAGDDVIHED